MTSNKISELTELALIAADDILHIVDYDAVSDDVANTAISVENLFGFIPVDVGLGMASNPSWGLSQLKYTGSPASGYNCGGQYSTAITNWATNNNNDAYGGKFEVIAYNGTPVGGYPTSDIAAVHGYARNQGVNTELDKMFGGSFEARQYGGDVGELYGFMSQATNMSSLSGDTTKLTGIFSDAYTSISTGAVAVGTLYGAELRTYGKTNVAGVTSAVTTAYGLYSSLYCQQYAGSTSTIGTAYNIYLTDLRPGGGISYGPVTTYYGLYIKEATKATTNWAIYSEGRHLFDQPTSDAGIPVIFLDQADISEGYVDFLGASAASAAGPISSWTTGNTIQGFVRVEINGVGYWMPYYDAPTS